MNANDRWGHLNNEDDRFFEDLTDMYMPASGKAETVGGEILRAINRIVYKYYNDGDTVNHYYSSSSNYSWACDSFLSLYVPTYISMKGTNEYKFEEALCDNLKRVVDYLRNNMEKYKEKSVFNIPNTIDCLDNAPVTMEYDEEMEYEEEDY